MHIACVKIQAPPNIWLFVMLVFAKYKYPSRSTKHVTPNITLNMAGVQLN